MRLQEDERKREIVQMRNLLNELNDKVNAITSTIAVLSNSPPHERSKSNPVGMEASASSSNAASCTRSKRRAADQSSVLSKKKVRK